MIVCQGKTKGGREVTGRKRERKREGGQKSERSRTNRPAAELIGLRQ